MQKANEIIVNFIHSIANRIPSFLSNKTGVLEAWLAQKTVKTGVFDIFNYKCVYKCEIIEIIFFLLP